MDTSIELQKNLSSVSLIEVMDKMSRHAQAIRNQKTDAKVIRERKGKGNQTWKYVDKITVQKWLDKNFPVWSFEALEWFEWSGVVYVKGRLEVICPISGAKRIFTCYGSDDGETTTDKVTGVKSLVVLSYIKNAETDALKRCVMRLGGFNDIYTDEVIKDTAVVDISEHDTFVRDILPILQTKPHIEKKPHLLLRIIEKYLSGEYSLKDVKEI